MVRIAPSDNHYSYVRTIPDQDPTSPIAKRAKQFEKTKELRKMIEALESQLSDTTLPEGRGQAVSDQQRAFRDLYSSEFYRYE